MLLLRLCSGTADSLTIATATAPTSYPLLRMVREHGDAKARAWIVLVLEDADALCGGKNAPETLAMYARMVLANFSHRSAESLIVAIRDGLNSGKIYGAINYPLLSEWLTAHEQKVLSKVENEVMATRFTGDNLGADYLDKQEHNAGAKDRLIDQLKRKLDAKPKKAE